MCTTLTAHIDREGRKRRKGTLVTRSSFGNTISPSEASIPRGRREKRRQELSPLIRNGGVFFGRKGEGKKEVPRSSPDGQKRRGSLCNISVHGKRKGRKETSALSKVSIGRKRRGEDLGIFPSSGFSPIKGGEGKGEEEKKKGNCNLMMLGREKKRRERKRIDFDYHYTPTTSPQRGGKEKRRKKGRR